MSHWLILALAILGLLLASRIVWPGKDQSGARLVEQNDDPFSATSLKVATFNVQTGKSATGERDIRRAAAVVSDADLIGVQEVYAPGWLNKLGLGQPQAKQLAGNQFGWIFAATRYRWFREQRGNVVLSRLPTRGWTTRMLPDESRKSPRNMMILELEWQGQSFVFINTHLHTGRGRQAQLAAVLAEFARHSRAILVGDFNSKADEPLLKALREESGITEAVASAELDEDPARIDWIFSKGFDVISGHSLPTGVSDHPYYQVELRLSEAQGSVRER